jgi:hypothetical protein
MGGTVPADDAQDMGGREASVWPRWLPLCGAGSILLSYLSVQEYKPWSENMTLSGRNPSFEIVSP